MTLQEQAQRIIRDYKGDKKRAYEHCLRWSKPQPEDELFACFCVDADEDRKKYTALAEIIKSQM